MQDSESSKAILDIHVKGQFRIRKKIYEYLKYSIFRKVCTFYITCALTLSDRYQTPTFYINKVAAFQGMHVLSAKHSYA